MSMKNISADDIREYIKQGEGPHIEFKTRFTADNLIARHLSAFANSGGGIIIFGVGSHGEIFGLSDEEIKQTMDRLKRLAQSLLPIYAYELDAVSIDGKPVVYLNIEEVNKTDRPIRLATGEALILRDGAGFSREVTEISLPQAVLQSSLLLERSLAYSALASR